MFKNKTIKLFLILGVILFSLVGVVGCSDKESKINVTVTNNTVGNVTLDVQVVGSISGEPVTGPVNIIIDDEIVKTVPLDDEGKAITVRLVFSCMERTLTREDVQAVVDEIIEKLEKDNIRLKS